VSDSDTMTLVEAVTLALEHVEEWEHVDDDAAPRNVCHECGRVTLTSRGSPRHHEGCRLDKALRLLERLTSEHVAAPAEEYDASAIRQMLHEDWR
jgi:hypothetical protein